MPKERGREVGRLGNKALRESGKVHRFTSAEASAAGKKGAEARRRKRLLCGCPEEVQRDLVRDEAKDHRTAELLEKMQLATPGRFLTPEEAQAAYDAAPAVP